MQGNDNNPPSLLPGWADEEASRQMPALRSRGEGQHIEYMRSFPEQARDLGKEIAAFASSGGGRILIGVEDDGSLCGVPHIEDAGERDRLVKRVEGICHGTVKPTITPRVTFAWESGRGTLVVVVPMGGQPVYYCAGRPYIRHLRESRPAEPNEVIELVQKWAGFDSAAPGGVEIPSDSVWLSELGQILVDILIAADEYPARWMNPWPECLQSDCETWAANLRDIVNEYLHGEDHLAAEIRCLAEQCDELASILHVRTTSTRSQVEARMPKIRKRVADLKVQLMDELPLSTESVNEAKETIVLSARKARDLVVRIDQLTGFRADDLMSEAASIGEHVLQIAHYPLGFLPEADTALLREAGRELHLVETMQMYLDGGQSTGRVAERIVKATEQLEEVAAKIDIA